VIKASVKGIFNYLYKNNFMSTQLIEEPGRFFSSSGKRLQSLKNKFEGQRCFIVGNGPSLNKHDLKLLKDEYSFGVNSIFYMTEKNGFKPTFYVVEDGHVINDNLEEIKKFKTDFKFLPSVERFKFLGDTDTIFLNFNRGFYEPLSPNFNMPRFSSIADKVVYCGQSVTIINLQLAYYMGFSEVYLIGMDFSYNIPSSAVIDGKNILSTEDDDNHFDPRYFGKGKRWHDPKLDNVLASYVHCKNMFERDGRKILNATEGGHLNVFERVDYKGLFL
jgi:hypothetical protein